MFGLIWGAIVGIGAAISGGKTAIENNESLYESINRDKKEVENGHVPHKTYYKYTFSGKMKEVRYDNGHQVFTHHDSSGDVIQEDMVTGERWNISESERNLKFEKEKRDEYNAGKKAIQYKNYYKYVYKKHPTMPGLDKTVDLGTVYKDVNTGELYVKRRLNIFSKSPTNRDKRLDFLDFMPSINNCIQVLSFYMNLNGMLVGLSDTEINHMKSNIYNVAYPTSEEINEYIKFFNQAQKNGGIYFLYGYENKRLRFDKDSSCDWRDYFICNEI